MNSTIAHETTTSTTTKTAARQIRAGDREGLFDLTRVYVGDARAALVSVFELAAEYLDAMQDPVSPELARKFAAGIFALHEVESIVQTIEEGERLAGVKVGNDQLQTRISELSAEVSELEARFAAVKAAPALRAPASEPRLKVETKTKAAR